ncbi:MAG: hypothetical protein RLN63_09080, partial [Miltoncostaeaceae bacterium]
MSDSDPESLAGRLEILTVARWLDDGRPDHGRVPLDVRETCEELDLEEGRAGLLALMAALGDLEARGVVAVSWPQGVGAGAAELTLGDDLRRDARR